MEDFPAPGLERTKADLCVRCLQPLPPGAARCPGCGQPATSRRALPLAIGVIGVCALLFLLFIMYRVVANEDLANGPAPASDDTPTQEEVLQNAASTDKQPAASQSPEKPEKPPPLNER